MRNWIKWGILPLCGVIALAAMSYAAFVIYLEHALKKDIAQLRHEKILLTYEELIPPVADEENAVFPMRELVRSIVQPPENLPKPAKHGASPENSPEDIARLAEWVERNQHVFTMMKQVLKKESYRMEFPMLLFDTMSSQDNKIRLGELYKIYDIATYLLLRNNNYTDALDCITDFLKFTVLYQKSCTSSAEYLVALIYSGNFFKYLDDIITRYDLNETQLADFLHTVNSLDFPRNARQALLGEMIFEYTTILMICNDENILRKFAPRTVKLLYFYYKNDIITDLPQYIDMTTVPFYLAKDKIEFFKNKHRRDLVQKHYTQGFIDSVFKPMPNIISRWDIMRLKLALILHHKIFNKFPSSLSMIDKTILSQIPIDPYKGVGYEYSTNGVDSFNLTSISYEQNWPEHYRLEKQYRTPLTASRTSTPKHP